MKQSTILLKTIRNCIADAAAELIFRVPVLELPFVSLGAAVFSLNPLGIFYRRTVSSLCDRWRRANLQYRKIQIEGHSFIFDATDFTICNWYFYKHLFEPETTRLILNTLEPGDTVLDIGSNQGYMSVLAGLKVGPTGRVFCFEPNPTIYSGLQRHLSMNQIDGHVMASTDAFSNKCSDKATFFVSTLESNSGLSSLTPYPELIANCNLSTQNTICVKTITLDEWVIEKLVDRPIDFIKIDVEGAEMLVLEGARRTLTEHPPKRWVIETQKDGPAVEFLKSYGYQVSFLDPAGDHVNVLFTHIR